MREAFNTNCDVYAGPGSALAGAYLGTFPCRFVKEDAIRTVGLNAPSIVGYITIDGIIPVGMWTSPFIGLDPSIASQVVLPSGGVARLAVLYADVVEWRSHAVYYRAYLVRLPIPPIRPIGGVLGDSSGQVSFSRFLEGFGGVLGDSSGAWSARQVITGVGGVLGDSSGAWSATQVITGVGGVLGDSSAGVVHVAGHTQYVLDNFTGTTGTALASHTPDIDQGTGWSVLAGTFTIVTNNAVPASVGASHAIIDAGHADCTITLTVNVPALPPDTVLLFRTSSTSSWWRFQWEGIAKLLYLYSSAGYYADTSPTTYNFAGTTLVLKVVLSGGSITCYANGATIFAASGQTFNQAVKTHGMLGYSDVSYTGVNAFHKIEITP
jgi:hypothetical protein